MGDFCTCFNKELIGINQVITGGENIHAFIRALGPRSSALYDNLSIIPVNTFEEMVVRVKSYIDLEIAKESRKSHKESNKEIHEGKKRSSARKRVNTKMISVAPWHCAPIGWSGWSMKL